MPAYSGLRVAQLRELCEERNIDHGGLTKPQLLEALRAFDRDEGGEGEEEEDGGLELGAEAAFSDGGSVAEFASIADQPEGGEPESVTVLRLKLALAEKQAMWEKEGKRSKSERSTREAMGNRERKIGNPITC